MAVKHAKEKRQYEPRPKTYRRFKAKARRHAKRRGPKDAPRK